METKYLKLVTMPDIVAQTSMLWEESGKVREVAMKSEANVAVLNGL